MADPKPRDPAPYVGAAREMLSSEDRASSPPRVESLIHVTVVPGLIHCPHCDGELEVRVHPRGEASAGPPVPLPTKRKAPDPKAEGPA